MQDNQESNFGKLHRQRTISTGRFGQNQDAASNDAPIRRMDSIATCEQSNGTTRRIPVAMIEEVLAAGGIPVPARDKSPKRLLPAMKDYFAAPDLNANPGSLLEDMQVGICRISNCWHKAFKCYSRRLDGEPNHV